MLALTGQEVRPMIIGSLSGVVDVARMIARRGHLVAHELRSDDLLDVRAEVLPGCWLADAPRGPHRSGLVLADRDELHPRGDDARRA